MPSTSLLNVSPGTWAATARGPRGPRHPAEFHVGHDLQGTGPNDVVFDRGWCRVRQRESGRPGPQRGSGNHLGQLGRDQAGYKQQKNHSKETWFVRSDISCYILARFAVWLFLVS